VLVKKNEAEYDIKLIDFAGAVLDCNEYPGIFFIYLSIKYLFIIK
jgi:hypothetical protein